MKLITEINEDLEVFELEEEGGKWCIRTDQWYHFVFTSAGDGTGQWYQDGVPLSMTTTGGVMTGAFQADHFGWGFYGEINEIAIYEKELNASQVRTIYNGREPYNHKEGIASGTLVSWFRMGWYFR